MAYHAHGNRTLTRHPDGKTFEYAYDAADKLFHLSENGPSITLASIFYDAEGLRDELHRDVTGAITRYDFDPVSRLEELTQDLDGAAVANDATLGFDYNPASQIVTRSLSNNAYEFPFTGSVKSYAVNGRNQYTQVGSAAHAWDLNGNVTDDGPTSFGYDTENRLVSASGAKTASLSYDPLGRLYQVTTTTPSATTRFVYDGDRLIAEYSSGGTLLRRYVHGPGADEPLVWYEGSAVSSATRRYLHADHQGSIVAASTATGAVVQVGAAPYRYAYDAYGITGTDNTLRFQYTGQAAIPELGLLYYKARFYNPGLGRFMQTDPIGYDDDVNLYAYVGNDPLSHFDSTGRSAIAVHFRDQPIRAGEYTIPQWVSGGHSGVTMINDATGYTAYREFGRYNNTSGVVRRQAVSNLQLGKNGIPTVRSVEKLLRDIVAIGTGAGSEDISVTFTLGSDFAAMQTRSATWQNRTWNPVGRNTCHGYSDDVVAAGGDGPTLTADLNAETVSNVAGGIVGLYEENQRQRREDTPGWFMWGGGMITGSRACGSRIACN